MTGYNEFLVRKAITPKLSGFEVPETYIHPLLFDWQRRCVQWSLALGKAALFQACGLGKTLQQLEWSRLVAEHTGGKVLILAPLAVARQTVDEGNKIGLAVRYCRSQEEADKASERIIITNYDMLKAFDAGAYAGVVLDESSILKAFMGTTKRLILEAFAQTPYKLACTATPAPNDHLELGNHADFLGIMPSNEMITRWFINDSMASGNYRLKRHAAKDFWRWVCSWAVCISTPSDIGYPDDGFILPPLEIHNQVVGVDHSRAWAEGKLLLDTNLSATTMWKEKKATAQDRCQRAADLVKATPGAWIVWCDTNHEADILKGLIPDAVEIRGSETIETKERKLELFMSQRIRVLVAKKVMFGYGLNMQFCHQQVFAGVDYSFESTYQAMRRCWRFGQTESVQVHLISAESEGDIMQTLERKQEAHREMQEAMNEAMGDSGLVASGRRELSINVGGESASGEGWTMYRDDCIQSLRTMEDDSIDFTIFSPPFSNLYIYSDSVNDMGNCAGDAEFFEHFGYLLPELLRVTLPGRLMAIHCKDLPLYRNRDDAAGLRDFPGHIIAAAERAGWTYHSRVTVWKDPVIEMQRTKNHGLLYKNLRLRGEVTRQGMADYVVVFRKWQGLEDTTTSSKPVLHDREDFELERWQRYASPVWFDIAQTRVLNCRLAREGNDEKHICPLQLDVIERCLELWTNAGDLVLSPFAGIGSEGYVSIEMGRRFVGVELKRSYFDVACDNLREAEAKANQVDLFAFAGVEVAS